MAPAAAHPAHPVRPGGLSAVLRARLGVLMATTATVGALLGLGFAPLAAAVIALAATAGAVEMGCRLTMPAPAPKVRASVVVVVLVVVVQVLRAGVDPVPALLLVLGVGWMAVECARRLTGARYRLPGLPRLA